MTSLYIYVTSGKEVKTRLSCILGVEGMITDISNSTALANAICGALDKEMGGHNQTGRFLKVWKGRFQNSLPLTTDFSQKFTEPSGGISYPVGDLCRHFTNMT